jgi:hypothetical protein
MISPPYTRDQIAAARKTAQAVLEKLAAEKCTRRSESLLAFLRGQLIAPDGAVSIAAEENYLRDVLDECDLVIRLFDHDDIVKSRGW